MKDRMENDDRVEWEPDEDRIRHYIRRRFMLVLLFIGIGIATIFITQAITSAVFG